MSLKNKEIWISHYHLSNDQYGVALGYAENREIFAQHMQDYCQLQGVTESHQLAPLPLHTWIKRHGMNWSYQHYADQLSWHTPFVFIPQEELETAQGSLLSKSYVIENKMSLTQLGRQFGERFPCVVPKVLTDKTQNGFFASMDWYADYADEELAPKVDSTINDGECLNYYLVMDANKSFFFPKEFINHLSSVACLFKGKSEEATTEVAPYLVQLTAGDQKTRDFVQRLFTQNKNELLGYWDINPAIFIRSYCDFDSVLNHLRKFTHLLGKASDGKDKWYFFRFYAPDILVLYLKEIANYPSYLKSFFGTKADESQNIIESFGVRSSDIFYHFLTKDIPKETVSAPILYGDFENEIFKIISLKILYTKKIIASIPQMFPNKIFAEELKDYWFNETLKLGFDTDGAIIRIVHSMAYLHKTETDVKTIMKQINSEYGNLSATDISKLVYERAQKISGENNVST